MAITVYNPKYFKNVSGNRVVNEADVKRFVWSHGYWNLKVGEMKKFPDDVGEAMIRLIEFLVEVTPKNIDQIKKEIEEKLFKCDQCEFETNTRVALSGHQRSHKSEKQVDFEGVEAAVPQGRFKTRPTSKMSIEEEEGIPKNNGEDADGVSWYGEGVQDDQDTEFKPRMG